jgi:hypothetical protein
MQSRRGVTGQRPVIGVNDGFEQTHGNSLLHAENPA